jgi:hypothetical protein
MNDLDGACGMYGRQDRCIQGFGGETRERNQLEDLGIDGRIILKCMLRKWDGVTMDWIDLAQDKD